MFKSTYFMSESDRQSAGENKFKFTMLDNTPTVNGHVIDLDTFDYSNYEKNPIVLWQHDRTGLPIGRMIDIKKKRTSLEGTVQFDMSDDFAMRIAQKVRDGYLNAVSVGFQNSEVNRIPINPNDRDARWLGPWLFKGGRLFEVSVVNVPEHGGSIRTWSEELENFTKQKEYDKLVEELRAYSVERGYTRG